MLGLFALASSALAEEPFVQLAPAAPPVDRVNRAAQFAGDVVVYIGGVVERR